jgi:DNA-directed RNA polymerase subunit RPC12/RpoP
MDNNTKIGFCAETHKQDYKCANCGHEKSFGQITNHYEHKIVEWGDKVCPECGFKSLKPIPFSLELSAEVTESIRKTIAKLQK